MSQPPSAPVPPVDFSQARPIAGAAGAAACVMCRRQIQGAYFSTGGKTFCGPCRDRVVAQYGGSAGGGATRAVKAIGLGIGGGLVSAALISGIGIATGLQIGIISILAGFIVGRAVRMGSENRGGLGYQFLAAGITYFASTLGLAIQAFYEMSQSGSEHVTGLAAVLTALFLVVAGPFLLGANGILFIVIVGFGVWRAWKMNGAIRVNFTGPHPLYTPPPVSAASQPPSFPPAPPSPPVI